jgi:nucleoside-diphosphate-sugar epimerase
VDRPVLITGGTGFIGSYVARRLLDLGRRVCLYDRRPPSPEAAFVLGDHRGAAVVELGSIDDWPRLLGAVKAHRPSHVVHAASVVDPAFLAANPSTAINVNFGGTITVLEAARLFDVQRVVYFSSIGVLPSIQYEPIDAAHPIFLPGEGPATQLYAAAKVAGEAFCFGYQQAYGVDFRTVRPSAVYGFGMQWPIYLKPIVEGAVRGERVRLPTGGPYPRDYTHAADVAGLVAALLGARPDADRIFYAATGEPLVTAADVARIVRELVPGADVEVGDELTLQDRLELPMRGRLSIESARTQLGWEPTYRSIRDGLTEYIERYRSFLAA